LRWLDDVENDLRVMKVKRWRKKAQNREEWASVIKKAKVLKGWQSQEASNPCPLMLRLGHHIYLNPQSMHLNGLCYTYSGI
jgi:hypothetical protein